MTFLIFSKCSIKLIILFSFIKNLNAMHSFLLKLTECFVNKDIYTIISICLFFHGIHLLCRRMLYRITLCRIMLGRITQRQITINLKTMDKGMNIT